MPEMCAHEIRQTLEDSNRVVLRGGWPGVHYRERRQRRRWHMDVLRGWGAVWALAFVDVGSDHDLIDRGSGNLRPHGRSYWQGA